MRIFERTMSQFPQRIAKETQSCLFNHNFFSAVLVTNSGTKPEAKEKKSRKKFEISLGKIQRYDIYLTVDVHIFLFNV